MPAKQSESQNKGTQVNQNGESEFFMQIDQGPRTIRHREKRKWLVNWMLPSLNVQPHQLLN